MPRINPNSAPRQAWRARHAGLVDWLRSYSGSDAFIRSLAAGLQDFGSLTPRQTAAALRNMEAAQNAPARPQNAADRAAGPDDCPHIYNGVYTMDDGAEHLTFQVYTVTRGRLQGKRIVKRQLQYGEFQGFAFVGAEGTLELWRRFADQATERYVVWATLLLEILNQELLAAPGVDTLHATTAVGRFAVNRSRACRRCNRALTVPTSIESGIGPECARRSASDNRTTVADPHVAVTAGATRADRQYLAQRQGGVRQSHQTLHDTGECFCSDPTGAGARAVAAEAVRQAAQPTLSELGTGEIQ